MRFLSAVLVWVFSAGMALAQVPLTGSFTASQNCAAVQSIKKGTNPGDVTVKRGDSYALRGKNKEPATHYLIEVPGANPAQRWVAVSCGSVLKSDGIPSNVEAPPPVAEPGFFILAVSWQPAFCEGHPKKPECASQTDARYDARNFTLHGLWPQPRSNVFCGVNAVDKAASAEGRWNDLPAVQLLPATWDGLDRVMPGTQSKLERHEWIKHGTCYGADMETYYRDSIRLIEALNATAGTEFMAANLGKTVTANDLRAQFDATLGAGAGDRMRISCKKDGGRELLTEITVGLKGAPAGGTPLGELIMAAAPTEPGCPAFVVDPVGLQ